MRFTREDDFNLPVHCVLCPFCTEWVTVDGYGMLESLWMHEYDCSAIALDYELAVGYEAPARQDDERVPERELPLAA
jgi:hypothetical protein